MDHMSLEGWRSFGVRHEQIIDNRDIADLSRALAILNACAIEPAAKWEGQPPLIDWFAPGAAHEYWLLPFPYAPPLVCVRPGTNPFDSGYLVSSQHLSHLPAAQHWEITFPTPK